MSTKLESIAILALGVGGMYVIYKFLNPEKHDPNDPNCGLFQYYCVSNRRCLSWFDMSCPDGTSHNNSTTKV